MDDGNAIQDSLASVAVESASKLVGAASLIGAIEDQVRSGEPASPDELAAIRCVVESCAADLDAAWARL